MSTDYYNLAIKRESTREYKKKEVSPTILDELRKTYENTCGLIPDIETEMILLDNESIPKMKGIAGYHKFLVEAPHYILLLSSYTKQSLKNAGFIGEKLVLKLTEAGIDTCWTTIGDEQHLREALYLDTDKEAMALIAFGYGVKNNSSRIDIKSPSDILIKKRTGFVAPKLSIDHAIYEGEWGKEADLSQLSVESELYQAFIAACCAPSFLNLQPYRLIYDKDKVLLVSLEDKVTDSSDTQLNLGIVMEHFAEVMARQSRMLKGWVLEAPDKDYHLPEGAKIEGCYEI